MPNYDPKPVSPRLLPCAIYLAWKLGSFSFEGQYSEGHSPDTGQIKVLSL